MSEPGTAPRASRKSSTSAVFIEVSWRHTQRAQPTGPSAGGGPGGAGGGAWTRCLTPSATSSGTCSLTSVISHRRPEVADPLPQIGGHRVPRPRQQQHPDGDHQYAADPDDQQLVPPD